MEEFNIEVYLNSLPDDTTHINVSRKGLYYLPSLARFTNLRELNCSVNNLTHLPEYSNTVEVLICSFNQLTTLRPFSSNLRKLDCFENKLTSLPPFPVTLVDILCARNNLTRLPSLHEGLKWLYCYSNNLRYLPIIPNSVTQVQFVGNYIGRGKNYMDIMRNVLFDFHFPTFKANVKALYRFIHLYYALKFIRPKLRYRYYLNKYKNQFKSWLWIRVREKRAKLDYHPRYLEEHMGEDDDIETVLENWDRHVAKKRRIIIDLTNV